MPDVAYDDLAVLYAAGALTPVEMRDAERRMMSDMAFAAEVRAFEESAAMMALALPPVAPSPRVRERLMAQIMPEEEIPAGFAVLRAGKGEWQPSPFKGVETKLLHYDKKTSLVTNLVRMKPGTVYPTHRHADVEQCFVIEGDIRMDSIVLRAGDYGKAFPTTTHEHITTEAGCVLLIVNSRHDDYAHAH